MRRAIWATILIMTVGVVVWTTPPLRVAPHFSNSVQLADETIAKHPEWRGATVQRTNVIAREGDAIDAALVRRGERVLRIVYTFGDASRTVELGSRFTPGNRLFYQWWALLIASLVMALLCSSLRQWKFLLVVYLWLAGWSLLSSSDLLRVSELWMVLGAIGGILYGGWRILRARTSASSSATSASAAEATEVEAARCSKDSGIEEDRGPSRIDLLLTLSGVLVGGALIFFGATITDVALATLEGAQTFLHGDLIYGNARIGPFADTYPPMMYLGYIPSFLFGPEIEGVFSPMDAMTVWNYVLYAATAAWAYRVRPRIGAIWAWSFPIILVAGAGANDILLCTALLAGALGVKWGYAVAAGIKLLPLAWAGALIRTSPLGTVVRLLAVATISVLAVVFVGGFDGISAMLHGISFQAERQTWNDVATLFGATWWHPVTRALAAVLALLAFRSRPGEGALWAWTIGCSLLLAAQYTNIMYGSWVWVLALGVALADEKEKES